MSSALHGIGTQSLLDASSTWRRPRRARGPSRPATSRRDRWSRPDADGAHRDLVFKTISDPYSGKISLLRVVSGRLPSDTTLWNSSKEESERLGHLQ